MPQSFQEWMKEKKISRNIISRVDISYREIEETNLIISGNEFPKLERVISRNGNNKLEKVVLSDLSQLTELKLWSCQIKDIKISNCPNLTHVDVRNNLLTDLVFIRGLEEKLVHLDVSNNNLKGWLPFLGNFKNLESLFIGNRINNNIINVILSDCFQGSLEELKELSNLKKADISNTNIDSGLEHLPESTEEIGCSCYYFWRRRCLEIKEQLKDYLLEDYELKGEWYNVSAWRESKSGIDAVLEETHIEQQAEIVPSQTERNRKQIIIINGNISVSQGHLSMANTFGDQANLNYTVLEDNKKTEQQAQILQNQSFGIPGSSKK